MNPYFIELYKRDINGNILKWSISNDSHKSQFIIEYGRLYGNRHIFYKASDGDIDAKFKSIVNKQKQKGYKSLTELRESKENHINVFSAIHLELDYLLPKFNTDNNGFIQPMKAHKFKSGKIAYPAVIQAKINGVRALISYREPQTEDLFSQSPDVIITSKNGITYNVKHIQELFSEFYNSEKGKYFRDIIFDGELYIKDEHVTTICGAARNENNPKHSKLIYVIFDLAIDGIPNNIRNDIRQKCFQILKQNYDSVIQQPDVCNHSVFAEEGIKIVNLDEQWVNDDETALRYLDEMLYSKFEGVIVRQLDAEYGFGQRVSTMRKIKKWEDGEFEIVDIKSKDYDNSKVGFSVVITCKNDIVDNLFNCTVHGTFEERQELLNSNVIGKIATLQYYERTKDKKPFHAKFIGIRDYE